MKLDLCKTSNANLAYSACVAPAAADESAFYKGLKPDQFIRRWLVLDPIAATNQDGAPIEFKRGRNQLLLKVRRACGAWGFCCA